MDLNEYIKQSYKRPNRQVLESLGANERLIEYLMKTPWNTNMAMIDVINNNNDTSAVVGTAIVGQATIGGGSDPDIGEVWWTGTALASDYEGEHALITLVATDKANELALTSNSEDYDVSFNSTALPFFMNDSDIVYSWSDGTVESGTFTRGFMLGGDVLGGDHILAIIPTSSMYEGDISIIVKHK